MLNPDAMAVKVIDVRLREKENDVMLKKGGSSRKHIIEEEKI